MIHVNSAAVAVRCAKIRQLQVKLTRTAAIEIELLKVFHRSVNSVIRAALTSGASRMIHGKNEFIGFADLKFQTADVFHVRRLSRAKQRDENRETHRYFGSCHCDDEKDEHLRVVIGQPA